MLKRLLGALQHAWQEATAPGDPSFDPSIEDEALLFELPGEREAGAPIGSPPDRKVETTEAAGQGEGEAEPGVDADPGFMSSVRKVATTPVFGRRDEVGPGEENGASSPREKLKGRPSRKREMPELPEAVDHRLHSFTGHERQVQAVAVDPAGVAVAGGDLAGRVRIWNLELGREVREVAELPHEPVEMAFDPSGAELGAVLGDHTVRIWDLEAGKEKARFDARELGQLDSLAFSPDGRLLAASGDDGNVLVWERETGELLWHKRKRGPAEKGRAVRIVGFSLDSKEIAAVIGRTGLRAYRAETGEGRRMLPTGETEERHLSLSPGWRYATRYESAPNRQALLVVDLTTAHIVHHLTYDTLDHLARVEFGPYGHRLAVANGPEIEIWSMANGERVRTLEGHVGNVTELVFSPDGRRLISAGADHSIQVWDLSDL